LLATLAQAPNLIAFRTAETSAAVATALPGTNHGTLTPASWHPEPSFAAPQITPAVYVPAKVEKPSKPAATANHAAQLVRTTAVQHNDRNSATPKVRRAAFTGQQSHALPAALVLVKQTEFYSDGARVWAVSTYQLAVFQPQPTTPNDFSRRAI
jgi:hypothetical protein